MTDAVRLLAAEMTGGSHSASGSKKSLKTLQQTQKQALFRLTNHILGIVTFSTEENIKTPLGWWSFPFCYIAKMATIEEEKCPVFHIQLFDHALSTPPMFYCHNCQCECTYALKMSSVSMEELTQAKVVVGRWSGWKDGLTKPFRKNETKKNMTTIFL